MFTVDASVYLNALKHGEEGCGQSLGFLEHVHRDGETAYSPTLLLVELAAAASRALNDPQRAVAFAQSIRDLPGQVWIPLDYTNAMESSHLAATYKLRGSDAVYAAVASRHKTILVTRDRQQLERLPSNVSVATPEEALAGLT